MGSKTRLARPPRDPSSSFVRARFQSCRKRPRPKFSPNSPLPPQEVHLPPACSSSLARRRREARAFSWVWVPQVAVFYLGLGSLVLASWSPVAGRWSLLHAPCSPPDTPSSKPSPTLNTTRMGYLQIQLRGELYQWYPSEHCVPQTNQGNSVRPTRRFVYSTSNGPAIPTGNGTSVDNTRRYPLRQITALLPAGANRRVLEFTKGGTQLCQPKSRSKGKGRREARE